MDEESEEGTFDVVAVKGIVTKVHTTASTATACTSPEPSLCRRASADPDAFAFLSCL
jgi:hypothetical protein